MSIQKVINSLDSLPVLDSDSNDNDVSDIFFLVLCESKMLGYTLEEIEQKRRERVENLETEEHFSASEQEVWARTEQLLKSSRERIQKYVFDLNRTINGFNDVENLKKMLVAVAGDLISFQQLHYTNDTFQVFCQV